MSTQDRFSINTPAPEKLEMCSHDASNVHQTDPMTSLDLDVFCLNVHKVKTH